MTSFDTWLKAQQAKGAYLNDMPHDGWTDTIELCGACGLFDDPITHDCEADDNQGTCDTCGATYATHSREGRCGNCGNCANHCDHQDSNETGNCDCCFEVKPLKQYKHEGDFFFWCATCVENEDYLRIYDND